LPKILDRYVLQQTFRPLAISLAVVLLALLLERILRLFDLLANRGGDLVQILTMAANLIPHYMGLALPAAFFISVFLVVARSSEDHELDALRSTGVSIRRFSVPFLGLGIVLVVFSLFLSGWLQPYTRYAYRAIYYAVTHAEWDARVLEGTFLDTGRGYTMYANRVDASGHRLLGIFIRENQGGHESVITAERGMIDFAPDGVNLQIQLQNAVQIRTDQNGVTTLLTFEDLNLTRAYPRDNQPFRQRGDNERELTTPELWTGLQEGSPVPRASLAAEFHARLVRAVSMFFLPMLAVPMGLAARRARRGPGIAVAALILGLYHHTLQLGESMADLGRISPVAGLWLPFVLFAAFSAWLFFGRDRRAGGGFGSIFDLIHAGTQAMTFRLRPGNRQ
jgi:lipopolysaccharide export system permease protein